MINGPAEAGSHRRDPSIVGGNRDVPHARNEDASAIVVIGGPVEVPLAADDELADLVIAADLPAANKYAVVSVIEVRHEERVVPAVVGPGTANVAADIESGPTEDWQRWGGGAAFMGISAAKAGAAMPRARAAAITTFFIDYSPIPPTLTSDHNRCAPHPASVRAS